MGENRQGARDARSDEKRGAACYQQVQASFRFIPIHGECTQALKLEPQPQDPFEFGLLNLKPAP